MNAILAGSTDGRRRRRRHSPEFKAAVVAQCCRPGMSIAAVALANGLNASLLRRCIAEGERSGDLDRTAVTAPATRAAAKSEGFVPVEIAPGSGAPEAIRVELRTGASVVIVSWPLSAAAHCAVWLRELLR